MTESGDDTKDGGQSGPSVTITVVVLGVDVEVKAPLTSRLYGVIAQALADTGNTGRPLEDWWVRDEYGDTLDPDYTLDTLGLQSGERLWLQVRSAGGPEATGPEASPAVLCGCGRRLVVDDAGRGLECPPCAQPPGLCKCVPLASLQESLGEFERGVSGSCMTCPAKEVPLNRQHQCPACVHQGVPAEVLACTGCARVAHAYCGGKEGEPHKGCTTDGTWKRWPLVDGAPAQPVPLRRQLLVIGGGLLAVESLARDAVLYARLYPPTADGATPEALRHVARGAGRLFRMVEELEGQPAVAQMQLADAAAANAPSSTQEDLEQPAPAGGDDDDEAADAGESIADLVKRAARLTETHLDVCREMLDRRPDDEQWRANVDKLGRVLGKLGELRREMLAEEPGLRAMRPVQVSPPLPVVGWKHERLQVVLADVADGMRWLLDVLNLASTYAHEERRAGALGIHEDLEQLAEEAAENVRLLRFMQESWHWAKTLPVDDLQALRARIGRPGVLAARRPPSVLTKAEPEANSRSVPLVLRHGCHLTLLAAGFNASLPVMVRSDASAKVRRAAPMLERIAARTLRDGRTLAALSHLLGLPKAAPVPKEWEELDQALAVGRLEAVDEGPSETAAEVHEDPDRHLRGRELALTVVPEETEGAAELRPRVEGLGWDLVGREGPHWVAVRRLGEVAGGHAEVRADGATELLGALENVNRTEEALLRLSQLSEEAAAAYIRSRIEGSGWVLEGYEGGRWCARNPETGVRARHPDGLMLLELLKASTRGEEGRGHDN